MPDITMCNGVELANIEDADPKAKWCPRRESCHRHIATPTPRRQSYFTVLPLNGDGSCNHYWPADAELVR